MTTTAALYTAGAYYLIGFVLLGAAGVIWWTHPVNRALLFGPFVTVAGLRLVLRLWPLVWLFGLFIFSCGVEHHAHYLMQRGAVAPETVAFLGVVEAVVSVWTAASMAALTVYWLVARWLRL